MQYFRAHILSTDTFGSCAAGVNIGRASGQTVEHVHLHLIPRRLGDVADPRGGVRWVMPDSAAYWE